MRMAACHMLQKRRRVQTNPAKASLQVQEVPHQRSLTHTATVQQPTHIIMLYDHRGIEDSLRTGFIHYLQLQGQA